MLFAAIAGIIVLGTLAAALPTSAFALIDPCNAGNGGNSGNGRGGDGGAASGGNSVNGGNSAGDDDTSTSGSADAASPFGGAGSQGI
jgi:hypothetical protein